jgi:hypothetical protein
MKRKTGMPRIYLASSGTKPMPVANVEERLLSLLATLEECQAVLMDKASFEAGRLLSLAILELRMELHKVTDSELKALCDLMVTEDRVERDPRTSLVRSLPPYLKLVK